MNTNTFWATTLVGGTTRRMRRIILFSPCVAKGNEASAALPKLGPSDMSPNFATTDELPPLSPSEEDDLLRGGSPTVTPGESNFALTCDPSTEKEFSSIAISAITAASEVGTTPAQNKQPATSNNDSTPLPHTYRNAQSLYNTLHSTMDYHINQLKTLTLTKRIDLIPEGLTVKLAPAYELPPNLMTTWNDILHNASTQLRDTMLEYHKTQTNKFRQKIDTLTNSLSSPHITEKLKENYVTINSSQQLKRPPSSPRPKPYVTKSTGQQTPKRPATTTRPRPDMTKKIKLTEQQNTNNYPHTTHHSQERFHMPHHRHLISTRQQQSHFNNRRNSTPTRPPIHNNIQHRTTNRQKPQPLLDIHFDHKERKKYSAM